MYPDTVYFREKVSPDGYDWLHCKVLSRADGMIKVRAPKGFGGKDEIFEYPLTQVQRVMYGVDA